MLRFSIVLLIFLFDAYYPAQVLNKIIKSKLMKNQHRADMNTSVLFPLTCRKQHSAPAKLCTSLFNTNTCLFRMIETQS